MPNPLSALLDWLLTHLVALTLLGFLALAVFARGPLFGLHPPLWPAGQARGEVAAPQPDEPLAPEPAAPPAASEPAAVQPQEEAVFRPIESSGHEQFVPVPGPETAGNGTDAARPLPEPALLEDDPVDVNGLLHEARKAFWNGALEQAESLYLRYLALRPGDANSFGELGNLYQSMGRPQDALDAYFEAGVRFKSLGDTEQLAQILELLRETGDPRARQLGD